MLRSAVWMLMWMDVGRGRNKQRRRENSFVDGGMMGGSSQCWLLVAMQ
jgi:hypothetical protein